MTCPGTTLRGEQCRRQQEPGHNGFCAFHDPDGRFTAARVERQRMRAERWAAAEADAQERRRRELARLGDAINARYRANPSGESMEQDGGNS